jgi:hypothetical protein
LIGSFNPSSSSSPSSSSAPTSSNLQQSWGRDPSLVPVFHHQCYVKHLDPREVEHHHILIGSLGSQDRDRYVVQLLL